MTSRQNVSPVEQLRMLPGEDPDELLSRAHAEHDPIQTVCLFSGGNDSTVVAHRCRDWYGPLAFIDTGTAVPGVREFVHEFAGWLGKTVNVYESGDAFRRMVLNPAFGFPGPAQHGRAYTRLKERQIEAMLRDLKHGYSRSCRVLFVTGVRRAESARRATRMPITRRGGAVFVNPLIDWSDADMRRYRLHHGLPQSDVAALLHRSGECNCGSFASPGEREELQALWPGWFEQTIASLEREAEVLGVRACRWGERPGVAAEDVGALCSDCQLRLAA